jgi:DNA-binding transcriptional LysR family regulator
MERTNTIDKAKPPLGHIRSFECAARHLSFTRAATELGLTQAAVSMHIKSLENYLGSQLFHRRARSLILTEIGTAFLPTVRHALSLIEQATDTVLIGNQSRTVSISCPMSLAENWLAPRLVGFQDEHPNIELLVHGTIWDQRDDIGADLSIAMARQDEFPGGGHLILRDTLSLLCAPEIARGITTLRDIAALPRIVVVGRQDYWSAFDPHLGPDLTGAAATIRTNATSIAFEMAANGIGVFVAPTSLAQILITRGLLIDPFDLHPASPWGYVLTDATRRPTAAIVKVRNWLLRSP